MTGFQKKFSSTSSKSSQRRREGWEEEERTPMSFPNSHGKLFSRRKKNAEGRKGSRQGSIRLNLK